MARQLVAKRDVRPDELVEVGLAHAAASGGGGAIDKFRARVIFPIREPDGHAVGLGGRLLEGEGPEVPQLAGDAALRQEPDAVPDRPGEGGHPQESGQAVIVEGYTDALMAHQAGFDNVVASLGTALTPGQVALLSRYAQADRPRVRRRCGRREGGHARGPARWPELIGQLQACPTTRASSSRTCGWSACPMARTPTRSIRETPQRGPRRVAAAKPIVEYLIGHHAARFDLKTSAGRIGFVEAVMPILRDIADPLRRDEALQQVRRVSGVEERVLRQVLRRGDSPRPAGRGRRTRPDHSGLRPGARPDALPVGELLRAITPVEAELLRLLLLVPDQQVRVADELGPDQLPSTIARELYRAIVLQRAADERGVHPPFDSAALLASLDDETAALARALYARTGRTRGR